MLHGEHINKLVYPLTGPLLSNKKNDLPAPAATWVNLKSIHANEAATHTGLRKYDSIYKTFWKRQNYRDGRQGQPQWVEDGHGGIFWGDGNVPYLGCGGASMIAPISQNIMKTSHLKSVSFTLK